MTKRTDGPTLTIARVLQAPPAAFAVVAVLTALELAISATDGDRAARITALVGLLMAKAGLVLTCFMRAGASRRAARLALLALFAATGFAVVLMLEAASRARVR